MSISLREDLQILSGHHPRAHESGGYPGRWLLWLSKFHRELDRAQAEMGVQVFPVWLVGLSMVGPGVVFLTWSLNRTVVGERLPFLEFKLPRTVKGGPRPGFIPIGGIGFARSVRGKTWLAL
jgi:hypothetical protein